VDKRWKRHEREVAELLGGKRIPINGRGNIDIEHPWLAVEVKSRESLPEWFKNPLLQARQSAPEGRLPLVVWCEKGGAKFVQFSLSDFIEWFNPRGGEG
jgi:hypothetical protein